MQANDNNKLKVLFLSAWYPGEKDSMYGLFVKKHAMAVSRQCDVLVIYACPDESAPDTYRVVEHMDGSLYEIIVYYKTSGNDSIGKFVNFCRWVRSHRMAYRIALKNWGKPQIIHSNILTRVPAIALYLKLTQNIPYIISEHWSRYFDHHNDFKGSFRKALTRLVIRKASALTVVSERLGEAMKGKGITHNYVVLPNVVDTDLFRINKPEKPAGVKMLTHVSCFEERSKNMSGILRAIKILSEKRQDFVFRMIGTGQDFHKTVSLAEELGLLGRFVFFEGLLEGNDLADCVSQSDISILYSYYETFGIVVYESLACGVPVVVSDVADLKKHITEELGKVIPGDQSAILADAIDQMLDSVEKYDAENLRKFAVERFSELNICNQTVSLYKKALNSKQKD